MQGVVTPILTILTAKTGVTGQDVPVEMSPKVVIILRNGPKRNGMVPLHYSVERNHNSACTLYTYIT